MLDSADKCALPESYELLVDRQEMAATLAETLTEEYHNTAERARLARLKRAEVPEM